MRKKTVFAYFFKSTTALLLAVSLTVGTALYENAHISFAANALTASDLEEEFKNMEAELKNLKAELVSLTAADEGCIKLMSNYNKQIDLIEGQIVSVNGRFDILEQDIQTAEKGIADAEGRIAELNISIEQNRERFKERLKAFYLAGEANTLEILLGAKSFADFLNRYAVVTAVTQRDRALMKSLDSEIKEQEKSLKEAEELKSAVETERENMKTLQASLENKQKELDATLKELTEYIDGICSDGQKKQATANELDADTDAIEKEVEAAVRNSTGSFSGGEFLWPCPEYTRILSHYGYRTHPITGESDKLHNGTDIASKRNSPVLAANDGRVVAAYDYERSGYGKYVIIDHGGGYVTLYAHCNKVLVKEGDKVSGGDLIAQVGRTGTATEYYLHFEMRIKDETVNPMTYFPDIK